jgi:hypothetical protein
MGTFTPEAAANGGKKARDLRLGVHAASSQQLSEWGKRGGTIGGAIVFPNVSRAKKVLGGLNQPLEAKKFGAHVRWHVNRKVQNHRCMFCSSTESYRGTTAQ